MAEAQVEAGQFSSIDETLAVAVADLIAIQNDDLAWAKPYVDRARESVARGDVLTGDEYRAKLKAKLNALRSS